MAQQVETRSTENQVLSNLIRQQNVQRGELLKRLITAQEDERVRIARELHDGLGGSLGGLAFQTEAMERMIISDTDEALDRLNKIRKLIDDTSNRMYDLILDLRPSVLDDLGLVAATRSHATRFLDGTGITFDLDDTQMRGRLPPALETTLYRIFQEALNNVVRHANASHISIKFTRRNGIFWGEIRDDGQGFDLKGVQLNGETPRGLGLLGMKERIMQCGGNLEIITRPGSGTQIRIQIPLEEASCV
jgi:signal transduction histidine kinase